MKTNAKGIELIKRFEGFREKAYLCPAGVWTIGYGHTSNAGPPVVKPGMKVTKAQATEILKIDVADFEQGVRKLLKRDVNDNQFSALVSFAYNLGVGALAKSSVLKSVNEGRFDDVPRRLNQFVKARQGGELVILPGLVKRRAAEAALFMDDPSDDFSPESAETSAREMPVEPQEGKAKPEAKDAGAVAVGAGGAVAAQQAGLPWEWIFAGFVVAAVAYVAWRIWQAKKGE